MENAAVKPRIQSTDGLCRVQVEVIMPRVYVHTERSVVTSREPPLQRHILIMDIKHDSAWNVCSGAW